MAKEFKDKAPLLDSAGVVKADVKKPKKADEQVEVDNWVPADGIPKKKVEAILPFLPYLYERSTPNEFANLKTYEDVCAHINKQGVVKVKISQIKALHEEYLAVNADEDES